MLKKSCGFGLVSHPFGFAARICCGTLDGLVPCGISGIGVMCCNKGVKAKCAAKVSFGLFNRFIRKASS